MIGTEAAYLEACSLHRIGNPTHGDSIELSKTELDIDNPELRILLHKFFLSSFKNFEYHRFTFSDGNPDMNAVFRYAKDYFDNGTNLHLTSVQLASLLHERSNHPQIKPGDFFVASFSEIHYEGKAIRALGLFKSEQKQSFIKTLENGKNFELLAEEGISPEKLDKACLILDHEQEDGFRVLIIDQSNRGGEARYWRDEFLNLEVVKDEFHQTREFMNLTSDFVKLQLPEEFEVNKADQIDLLNRSVDFFKKKEKFVKEEFEQEVLQDQGLITSFQTFDEAYRQSRELDAFTEFEISSAAVKKQSKVFKSVLKLDKNFHIYIHGNKELIERGTDPDGRKYYKIYFEQES